MHVLLGGERAGRAGTVTNHKLVLVTQDQARDTTEWADFGCNQTASHGVIPLSHADMSRLRGPAWAFATLCAMALLGGRCRAAQTVVSTPQAFMQALDAASGGSAPQGQSVIEVSQDLALEPSLAAAFPLPFIIESGRSLVIRGGKSCARGGPPAAAADLEPEVLWGPHNRPSAAHMSLACRWPCTPHEPRLLAPPSSFAQPTARRRS